MKRNTFSSPRMGTIPFNRFNKFALSLFCLFLTTASLLHAQEYRGTISGQVTDPKGAVIPQTVVTAIGPQQTYSIKSGQNGNYVIPYVQPGTYTVTAEAPGFKKAAQQNVVIDVATKANVNFSLQIGSTSETVSVEENQLGLNLADASVGAVMDPEKVQNLPLNGRQVYMLMALTPGVRFNQTQFGATGYSGTRGWDESNNYSITGIPGTFNQFYLNGAPISQQGGGGAGTWNISPTIDAVQEFKIMTITYDAQYGRVGGGAMNTILKSGGPHFHGTLYDFWRNSVLDANAYQLNQQGSKKPFHNMHQFGGTIGGPFLKNNKGFFFFSYEGWRESLPGGIVTTVPTPDMFPDANGNVNLSNYLASVSGKQNGIYDPLTTTACSSGVNGCPKSGYIRQPFANNTIPANRVSQIGVNIMKLFPAPNRPGYVNNYVFNGSDSYHYNMPIARVDYNFTDATRLYGIFAWWSGHEYRNTNGMSGPAIKGNINNYRSSITQVLDLTHTFNPNLVGDVRVSFNRMWNWAPDGTLRAGLASLTPDQLGLSMPQIPTTKNKYAPEININDGYPGIIGNSGDPVMYETYDGTPSLTQVFHQHTFHYGGEVMVYHDVTGGVGQPNGNFSFSTGFTQKDPFQGNQDGASIASLLLGYPSGGSVQYTTPPYETYHYYGAYIQDDWKARSNLTFNLGLRWDTETSPVERHHHLLAGMCLTCVNPITNQITFPAGNKLPNGASMVNPIVGGVQFSSGKLTAYENTWGLFQPKAGFSWLVNRNLLLRGGYTLSKALGIELGGASAWNQSTSYNSSPDGGLHPALDFRNGTPFPDGYATPPGNSQGLETLVGTGIGIDMRNRKIPLVHEWSLGIQLQLPSQTLLEITYLGNHGTDFRASKQFNGLNPSDFYKGHDDPNYLNQQVTNPFYGVLPPTIDMGRNPTIQAKYLMVPYPQYNGNLYIYTNPEGYSNYHAMLVKAEKRISGGGALTKGLSFLTSFTWSKLMVGNGYLNNGGAGLVDAHPYYVIDGSDRPWDLAFSGLYGLPIGRGGAIASDAHGLLGTVINDWQLDWIFTNAGGTPIGYPNGDIYTCNGKYNIQPSRKSWSSYVNNSDPSCWKTFPPYTAVTALPRTTAIRNPWAQQTELGLEKKFLIREGMNLQFKAEAFNATNTPIFGGPNMGGPESAPKRNTSVADPSQPGAWSGYGTIGSTQQNFPRQLQLSLKLLF